MMLTYRYGTRTIKKDPTELLHTTIAIIEATVHKDYKRIQTKKIGKRYTRKHSLDTAEHRGSELQYQSQNINRTGADILF